MQETIEPGTSCQETEFHSFEGHLFSEAPAPYSYGKEKETHQ